MNPRVRDGLLGAAAATLLLVVALVVTFWAVTSPADAGRAPGALPSPGAGATAGPSGGAGVPPSDLVEGELWFGDLALDAGTVALPGSTLTDVTASGRGVRTGADGLVAAAMSVSGTVPFAVVAAELGDDVVLRAGAGGEAVVERTVVVAGRRLDVVASGTVEVVAGRLVVEPTSVDLGGPSFLARPLGALVRRLVTVEHGIEGLPEGLRLERVVVQDDGFRADLRGERVRLVLPVAPR
ncbi:LmeA family phospholipid-binding protein [Cellulomonas endophytica]|uniref:LmeA family phospholipid-binding protein n=1 Tax=Cellulomonas endophytica TaxID=2494735 RepID=UPI00101014F6|nr:LmeA family phospholipid-binding protein [Cellulomonas endophytica]